MRWRKKIAVKSNLYVIEKIDKIGSESIYRVECVCGSVGKITESGLSCKVSCGCSETVKPHRLGLSINSYKFIKFVKEVNNSHLYIIECKSCNNNSVVDSSYARKLCPKCPRPTIVAGHEVDLASEAERLGIAKNALRQRIERMPIEKALSMPRVNRGGCKDKYGLVFLEGELDTIPSHLRRRNAISRKGSVYYHIRNGVSPSDALAKCLSTPGRKKVDFWGDVA